MATNTTTTTICPACMEECDTLTPRTWRHRDPYGKSGWAYDDGEKVTGDYCPDCIAEIDTNIADYQRFLEDIDDDLSADEWKKLALKLATSCKDIITNWVDYTGVTPKERHFLKLEGF